MYTMRARPFLSEDAGEAEREDSELVKGGYKIETASEEDKKKAYLIDVDSLGAGKIAIKVKGVVLQIDTTNKEIVIS